MSRSSIGVACISLFPSVTLPALAVSNPNKTLARVDFPQPDSPTMATVSDSRASKLIASLALTTRLSPPSPAAPHCTATRCALPPAVVGLHRQPLAPPPPLRRPPVARVGVVARRRGRAPGSASRQVLGVVRERDLARCLKSHDRPRR